jgi:hypothetical protein
MTFAKFIKLRAGTLALVLGAATLWSGCEGEPRAKDASVAPSARTAEVSVRFDVSPQKTATVSVLAFGASLSGIERSEVLGLVDPLAAAAPERDCELRDMDLTASALVARGGSIELEELTGVGIGLGTRDILMRPFPRIYPDVATVIGGVVAEAGPLEIVSLPDRISLLTATSELPVDELAVPSPPRLLTLNGAAPVAGAKLDTTDGLVVSVSGGPGTIVEVRPFGATVAVRCSVAPSVPAPADGVHTLVIPRALLAQLKASQPGVTSSPLPASLEVVKRATLKRSTVPGSHRLSVEVRSSTTVELRP